MLPFLNIFGVALAFPPLLLITGLWLGAYLAEKHAHKHGVQPETIYNLVFVGLVAYILGGRLGFAAQHPSAFIEDPISLLSRNFGLFDPLSGTVVGLIAVVIYGQRKNLKFWPALDALTPALAALMLAVPLANFASGSAYGSPSQVPWAIELWGMPRHPVQLYEAAAAGLILYAVWPGKRSLSSAAGLAFLQFLAYTALARLFFEGFRGSSPVTFLDLRIAQLVAWVILAVVLWGIAKFRQKSTKA
jgi:phosphatidylglycerol:prolipoprotein diacylglycerol transferase